jgi:hypothetical protein
MSNLIIFFIKMLNVNDIESSFKTNRNKNDKKLLLDR